MVGNAGTVDPWAGARAPKIKPEAIHPVKRAENCDMRRIIGAAQNHRNFDELDFWSRAEGSFPNLSKMARQYLAVCASSTPSERCFSPAKLFIQSNLVNVIDLKMHDQ